VTRAAVAPPVLRLLFLSGRARSAFGSLRSLRIGASALPRSDVAAWRPELPPDCRISHTYASTEALIVAEGTVLPGDSGPEATVAAGVLQGCHEYALLDEDDRPVPLGEPGELVLRGRYVALGEWQAGRLVTGRMPPVPDRPGWRVFRTGDLLRVQPDGTVRVVGRTDRQVKINAIRIEPAEIEAVLRAEPGVTDAAVVSAASPAGMTLHGFVVASNCDKTALVVALRQRLSAALPMALRPSSLTVLDGLPTLPNGKIDLIALSHWTSDRSAR
jgi:acyl-coenzyme A synthetase/AMP-(fatty) acid ligase